MFVVRGGGLNVPDLLMNIALHSAAQRRIELRQITNFQALVLKTVRAAKRGYRLCRIEQCSERSHISRFPQESGYNPHNPLKYFSASIAAAQPDPAAVIACR